MSTSKEWISMFVYDWSVFEENSSSGIRIFGLNERSESMYVLVTDFHCWSNIELPDNITWTQNNVNLLVNRLDNLVEYDRPLKKEFRRSKKLYFANMAKNEHGEYIRKSYPFLKLSFGTKTALKNFSWKLKKDLYIPGLGKIQLKMHEYEASPLLQFQCSKNIKPASWCQFRGEKISDNEKESHCVHEYIVNEKNIVPLEIQTIAKPKILSFDIEVNSSNPNRMPQSALPDDKVFQISCVSCNNGESEEKYQKCLLSLCKNSNGEIIEIDQEKLGDDSIEIRMFESEGDLLDGFAEYVVELNPQVICGYNIFGFDIPYMFERSKLTYTMATFTQISCLRDKQVSKLSEITWSSSAYKNQDFKYIEAPGRIWVDLLPVVKRDYKFNSYKLDSVAKFFLGQQKQDLPAKGIFKCYKLFTPQSLAVCGSYCVMDSLLVLKLFEKLQIWIGLVEMSNTTNTPIFDLFTRGQQVKIYAQVYKKCLEDNIVIDRDSSELVSDEKLEKFTGAYVFTPTPGVYDMVTSFDFSSLYPSVIMAYNIDYSTLVLDPTIPDNMCHVFEWYDHLGCEHDTSIRKTKLKYKVCEKRYFRFLKEPMGVLPSLLKYLSDARTKAKNDKKKTEKLSATLQGEEKEQAERMVVVYDKKQLAYKVSSNSMYGGMGVKKGMMPFLPGAMSTTFMGRESIKKAEMFMKNNYNINLIYGDSVIKDTPVYVRVNNIFDICTIDNLAEKYGNKEWQDCIEEGKQEKEFYELNNVNIETWTKSGWKKINRIIRHKLAENKKIIRVLTHTGLVDVTDDHSLIRSNGEKISTKNVSIGIELLHNEHPIVNEIESISEDEATIMGFFMGDGSCGCYDCPSGKKYSWALNNSSEELNKKYLELCKKIYNQFEWVIMDTIESSGVYKIAPRGLTTNWIKEYRNKMYYYKAKIIPLNILNGTKAVRQAFFNGLYDADGDKDAKGYIRIDQKNQISAAHICWLASSLGYKTSINCRSDKENVYRITMTTRKQRKNPNAIKKMSEIYYEGYVYDLTTENHEFAAGIGKMIVHNTDSLYFSLPQYTKIEQVKDFYQTCQEMEKIVSDQFPKPIKFAFEENIYLVYFTLSKKRYLTLNCDTNGNIDKEVHSKGVLLSRRDNSEFIRNMYRDCVMAAFYRQSIDDVVYIAIEHVRKLMTQQITPKELSISKSVGNIGDYKIKLLPEDDKKCVMRLQDLCIYDPEIDINKTREILKKIKEGEYDDDEKEAVSYKNPLEYQTIQEYISKNLPGAVQLAIKMRNRGKKVDAGERLPFIVLEDIVGKKKAKQSEKIEDIEYYTENSSVLSIDKLYYIRLAINPMDEIFMAAYKKNDIFKKIHKYRENYKKVVEQLEDMCSPKLVFKEDPKFVFLDE